MSKPIIAGTILAIGLLPFASVHALDFSNATGADIVKENASKDRGYSSAQLAEIREKLAGRELTFHDGKVLSVGKSYDGNINVSVRFEVPGADILTPAFTVSGKVSDAAMAKIALALDEKAEIKSLTGSVAKGGFGFSLEDAKFVPAVMPSLEAEYDPATITGDEIVKFNASKKGGLSSAKMKKLTEDVAGRELTFHDGKVLSVGKSYDGNISISVRFEVPGADILTPAFTVSGKVSDAAMAKIALALDEKAEIKSLTGSVAKGGFGFSLEDAKFVPAVMPSLEAEYDPATITGDEIVKFNASKKGGLSSAKMKKLTEDVAGRELTFHDGKVLSVGKSYDGNISISVRFEVPGADILTPAFTVSGKVTEETMKERVRNLDEGTKVECLAGKVGRSGIGIFSLENVKVVVR